MNAVSSSQGQEGHDVPQLRVLDELHPGLSHGAVGRELSVKESTVSIK